MTSQLRMYVEDRWLETGPVKASIGKAIDALNSFWTRRNWLPPTGVSIFHTRRMRAPGSRSFHSAPLLLLFLVVILFRSLCSAAESSPTLTVGGSGANLYALQDPESEVIAKLARGEPLVPLAQGTERESWYMVRTQQGTIGWVKASEVKASEQVGNVFKEIQPNTWRASNTAGSTFSGTWTVEENPATGEVYGAWTLRAAKGKTVMSGTWSANKSPKGWDGAWRAVASGKKVQYSGTWSASVQLKPDARFADLFEAAVQDLVGGGWKSGGQSGSWSIQAFK